MDEWRGLKPLDSYNENNEYNYEDEKQDIKFSRRREE